MKKLIVVLAIAQACCLAADLTGNWVARDPLPDGTVRRTYLDLKQEGSRITGHIRATQFYYEITESSGGPDGFTLTASMHDGNDPQCEIRRQAGNGWTSRYYAAPAGRPIAADAGPACARG
jgi:hypothetical protein